MTVGERIRISRKAKKMSQEELGNLLSIGKSSISEWESGKRPIPIDTMEEIAKNLDVTVPYLMGWNVSAESSEQLFAGISSEALDLARQYDRLSKSAQKLISMFVLFESADVDVKNKVFSLLVDHSNAQLQSESAFAAASASALLAIKEEEETTPSAESK